MRGQPASRRWFDQAGGAVGVAVTMRSIEVNCSVARNGQSCGRTVRSPLPYRSEIVEHRAEDVELPAVRRVQSVQMSSDLAAAAANSLVSMATDVSSMPYSGQAAWTTRVFGGGSGQSHCFIDQK